MSDHPHLSIVRQCQLLKLARSSLYYQAKEPSDEELTLMRLIDQQYLETPFYGSRKMTVFLQEQGYRIIRLRRGKALRKRTQRLMRQLGIEAIYPKPRLSQRQSEHQGYPYLLRDLIVSQANSLVHGHHILASSQRAFLLGCDDGLV